VTPRTRLLALAAGAVLLVAGEQAVADHPGTGQTPYAPPPPAQTPAPAPVVRVAEPPLEPTPQRRCGPGSRPETGIQGRVPRSDHRSGRAAKGYTCNARMVGRFGKETPFGTIGGFKVERYVDDAGHECAYYDTTLLYPTNFLDQEGGVNVLDMSDPAHPVRTARLLTPAMLSPHESLVLSRRRGILAAVLGNAAFNVGLVDVYDISKDCRHPVWKATSPFGVFGHESGMAPDGKTFYSASPATSTIVALDISNPSIPIPLWLGNYPSHGLSISGDGNRAYVAGIGTGLIILDTSEIQARKPNPQVREVARLTWGSMSIPQNAIPVRINGRHYVVEIDEFGGQSEVGAARIIDIENETRPRVVSNLRLEVHQPENFAAQRNDPGAQIPVQGYAGHYCNVPRRRNPRIVACSMILSGLRVFDIRDPKHPREIAYFNAPIPPRATPLFEASNWAMSSPSFVPKRREIWYSDGYSGFYAVKLTNGVWPQTNRR
jgi:LVIVD repeat